MPEGVRSVWVSPVCIIPHFPKLPTTPRTVDTSSGCGGQGGRGVIYFLIIIK